MTWRGGQLKPPSPTGGSTKTVCREVPGSGGATCITSPSVPKITVQSYREESDRRVVTWGMYYMYYYRRPPFSPSPQSSHSRPTKLGSTETIKPWSPPQLSAPIKVQRAIKSLRSAFKSKKPAKQLKAFNCSIFSIVTKSKQLHLNSIFFPI